MDSFLYVKGARDRGVHRDTMGRCICLRHGSLRRASPYSVFFHFLHGFLVVKSLRNRKKGLANT